MRRRKQKQTKQAAETTPYTHVPREDTSPSMRDRSVVASTAFSDSTTAYALPSPRTDPWKQSWQSYSEPDASYAASNGYSNPRSPTGVPAAPVEMVSVSRINKCLIYLLTTNHTAWFGFAISKRIRCDQRHQTITYPSSQRIFPNMFAAFLLHVDEHIPCSGRKIEYRRICCSMYLADSDVS